MQEQIFKDYADLIQQIGILEERKARKTNC